MPVDWEEELKKRLEPDSIPGMLAHFDEAQLTAAVRAIIREELSHPHFVEAEEAFAYRFANTKGGSHSTQGSRIAVDYMDELPPGELNRRNFVEALHTNPLLKLPPAAWISRSTKLEHGKSRALFACDTVNYLHFDAPCRAVENAWRSRRCIIKPGGHDMQDIFGRVSKLKRYKLMLDYADFNSAHTLGAQKIVIRELFRDLNPEWLDWLISSVDNTMVKDMSGSWCKVEGTLMSGHRMTSIINTVLNAAYLRLVVGTDNYNACNFWHVGDDVLISCDSSETITDVVNSALGSQLRFQRSKQGFGTLCSEFLRMCSNQAATVRYLARSISSTVSGNWTRAMLLGKDEWCVAMQRNIWNVTNLSVCLSVLARPM